jgi:AraC-like DNA-binding protein
VGTPISKFTNKTYSLREVFGTVGTALEAAILAVDDTGEMIELANDFIRDRLPERDANVALIREITNYIVSNREITKVDDLASRFALAKRTLQRLFNQYVGVSPKWMIKRYRLHEAAELLNSGEAVNWPELALDLGYFDQAHFIKDFKTIVGWTPGEYTRLIGAMINIPILPVGSDKSRFHPGVANTRPT